MFQNDPKPFPFTIPIEFVTYLPADTAAEFDARGEELDEMLAAVFEAAKAVIKPGWEIVAGPEPPRTAPRRFQPPSLDDDQRTEPTLAQYCLRESAEIVANDLGHSLHPYWKNTLGELSKCCGACGDLAIIRREGDYAVLKGKAVSRRCGEAAR